MRLLWVGDLGPTGFGTVTSDCVKALLDIEEDVRLWQFRDEVQDTPSFLKGRIIATTKPGSWLTWDEKVGDMDRMRERMRAVFLTQEDGWSPEAVIIYADPASILRSEILDALPEGLPAFHYVAIEGVGLPPLWRDIWNRITPIAMAKSGAKEIGRLMGTEPAFVYHGVDVSVFHPATPSNPIVWEDGEVITSRSDAKRAFGIDPKVTVILRCDANMPRKAYGSLFRSMAPVLAAHPDALLFIHARRIGEGGNLDELRSHFPEHIARRIVVPDFHAKYGGLPRYGLATLYNMADLYVSNSSEGFGLTIAEAAACGVACVGIDFSAVPEVIGPAGIVVPAHPVENIYAHVWGVADEVPMANAVDHLLRNKTERWKYAGLGPEHIRKTFTWKQAAEGFRAIVAQRELTAVA